MAPGPGNAPVLGEDRPEAVDHEVTDAREQGDEDGDRDREPERRTAAGAGAGAHGETLGAAQGQLGLQLRLERPVDRLDL